MSTSPHTRARKHLGALLAFRLAAVAIGLSPFLAAELLCRANGWGRIEEARDPFVGFAAERPLFTLNEATKRFEIDRSRQAYFRPDSFAANKGRHEFRIFCLGGSTVQGRPYAIETSFTTWLELNLRAADDRHDWQVINCGGVSYASYRLAPIMRELLDHQPDLFIVYTGHNEFLEDRTYQSVRETPRLIARLHGWSARWRLYNLCRQVWLMGHAPQIPQEGHDETPEQPGESPPQLGLEVDALLDYRGGLDDYHRNDDWHRDVAAHYEFNLHRMVAMARRANVPLLLVNPTSNLKDCPPFKFTNRETLQETQREEFEQLWEQAKNEKQLDRKVRLLRQAIAIDDRHAGVHFLLGNTLLLQRKPDLARVSLVRAIDEDVCPLRMTTPLYAALGRVAVQTRTPLVDVRKSFQAHSSDHITGNHMLLDHIHPTISGHQQIADELLETLAELRIVTPRDDWRAAREPLFRENLAALDAIYYARGKQRLEGLILWTQGRADKLKPTMPATGSQDNDEQYQPRDQPGDQPGDDSDDLSSPDDPTAQASEVGTSDQNAGSPSPATIPGNDGSSRSATAIAQ